jgi:hypothetical protein
MIWLTWRQFRASAALGAAGLAVLAVILALTGPGLADDYADGIAACTGQDGCSQFVQAFFRDKQGPFLAVTGVALVLPALIGLFWGAPLIARELEAGTHRLVWNQSITRARWLVVKLGVTGLAAMAVAGLGTLAVTWWSGPIDKAAVEDFPRMEPLLFATRGIVPIGYAAFAFVLGVTVGMLVRRTLAAMAITLVAFTAVQIAMPLLVRSHLLSPTRMTAEIKAPNLDEFAAPQYGGHIKVRVKPSEAGAWVLSSNTVDASGRVVDTIPLSPSSGVCDPSPGGNGLSSCFAEIKRLGYRARLTYQPANRFWPLQWIETGIYLVLAMGLAGFCLWWLRNRLS